MPGRGWTRALGITEVDVDGRVALYVPASREVVTLNETASAVWRLAERADDLADLTELLAHRFDASAPDIEADVRAALETFLGLGLLLRSPGRE